MILELGTYSFRPNQKVGLAVCNLKMSFIDSYTLILSIFVLEPLHVKILLKDSIT